MQGKSNSASRQALANNKLLDYEAKSVLQEWHAYIRTMVQFHVLGEMFTRYFGTKLHGILPWADINRNCNTFLETVTSSDGMTLMYQSPSCQEVG